MDTTDKAHGKAGRFKAMAAFLLLSLFMYVSIMYKIINYGP